MKIISLIVLLMLAGCTVQVPQKLPAASLPKETYDAPFMKTGKTTIIGVSGTFCTSEKLLDGHALIIFPKDLGTQHKGTYIIMKQEHFKKSEKNKDAWIKSAKQDDIVIKENNKKVP